MGQPADGYPWHWSVYRWLDGEIATIEHIADLPQFAIDLAQFLAALYRIDPLEALRRGRTTSFAAVRLPSRAVLILVGREGEAAVGIEAAGVGGGDGVDGGWRWPRPSRRGCAPRRPGGAA